MCKKYVQTIRRFGHVIVGIVVVVIYLRSIIYKLVHAKKKSHINWSIVPLIRRAVPSSSCVGTVKFKLDLTKPKLNFGQSYLLPAAANSHGFAEASLQSGFFFCCSFFLFCVWFFISLFFTFQIWFFFWFSVYFIFAHFIFYIFCNIR